jgi:dipeptidyl aminopeptidase/acylaminoacyl peptidase
VDHSITFPSDGLNLSGVLHVPDGAKAKLPAIVVLHGFGSNKNGGVSMAAARLFASFGYITLRFDMRGCGDSEGERGRVICLEQVEDLKNAVSFLQQRREVDPKRIAVMGHSFGAAVAIYGAAVDPRLAACISSGGWGDGAKKFRKQHESAEAWKKFSDILEEGPRYRARTGRSMMVPRFAIVPIAPELRGSLAPGSIMEFPFEVVETMYAFTANDVVARIAPRPLLLLHAANDSVTPTEQSIDLFQRAGQPTDLYLVANTDHFMLAESNRHVASVVDSWLKKHFPL